MREEWLVDLWNRFKFVLQGSVGALATLLFILLACINLATWIYPGVAHYTSVLLGITMTSIAVAVLHTFAFHKTDQSTPQKLTLGLPSWVEATATALFIYMLLNFGFCFLSSIFGGGKDIPNGALEAAESVQLEKTARWYSRFDLSGIRIFSAFWMLFIFQIAAESFYRKFTTHFGRYDGVIKRL